MTEAQTEAAAVAPAAPVTKPAPVIRLDKTKVFSENLGETTPDDPLYRVRYWQGQKLQNAMVLLPFDAHGNLVPDDNRDAPFQGMGPEGKPVIFHPLWTERMRALLAQRTQRAAAAAAPSNDEGADDTAAHDGDPADEVNFEAWLRGQARYAPHLLRAAAKKRFSKNYQDLKQLAIDLVEDEELVPVSEVGAAFADYFKPAAA